MLILLDCRPLMIDGPGSERSRFVFSVVSGLSRDPRFQWLLVTGSAGPIPQLPGARVITQSVWPGKLGWRYWYDTQIPRLAKKQRVDWIMTTGGIAAQATQPQCIWMPERADPKESRVYPPLYPGRLTETLHRAKALICYSDRDRNWLAGYDAAVVDKGIVLHPSPAGSAAPLTITGREAVKAEFAAGREYFLADAVMAGEEGLIRLLKAFSLFKKRQLSNLRLVIRGIPDEEMQKKLVTYKYRDDVHWYPSSTAGNHRLLAGAYAAIFLFEKHSLGGAVLDAWKSGVPVIAASGGPLGEEAVLNTDDADPGSLATHLMSLYKDEALRNRLVSLGLHRVRGFSEERTADAVRSILGRSL